ncbi:hypothetical protein [Streptomyces glaucescens]|uniref:hypothetical protein n=1 Tax=Streptomyces glaucescens TaxID=1907 RepID=UPI000A39C936|nr:hypothetical protein [Streptomyces glaucescens]
MPGEQPGLADEVRAVGALRTCLRNTPTVRAERQLHATGPCRARCSGGRGLLTAQEPRIADPAADGGCCARRRGTGYERPRRTSAPAAR